MGPLSTDSEKRPPWKPLIARPPTLEKTALFYDRTLPSLRRFGKPVLKTILKTFFKKRF